MLVRISEPALYLKCVQDFDHAETYSSVQRSTVPTSAVPCIRGTMYTAKTHDVPRLANTASKLKPQHRHRAHCPVRAGSHEPKDTTCSGVKDIGMYVYNVPFNAYLTSYRSPLCYLAGARFILSLDNFMLCRCMAVLNTASSCLLLCLCLTLVCEAVASEPEGALFDPQIVQVVAHWPVGYTGRLPLRKLWDSSLGVPNVALIPGRHVSRASSGTSLLTHLLSLTYLPCERRMLRSGVVIQIPI